MSPSSIAVSSDMAAAASQDARSSSAWASAYAPPA
jgi:hypothetical protein